MNIRRKMGKGKMKRNEKGGKQRNKNVNMGTERGGKTLQACGAFSNICHHIHSLMKLYPLNYMK